MNMTRELKLNKYIYPSVAELQVKEAVNTLAMYMYVWSIKCDANT